MCGINGGWAEGRLPRVAVERSLDAMKHRGPDDSGVYQDGPVFLGNRRLSVIDLKSGHQPILNEDGSVAVVLNGEIYNYLELMQELRSRDHVFKTRCDTEVLVHLYEDQGPSICEKLRGMFAFAIWDSRSRLLVAGRDRFGKKPLYYCRPASGGLLFASELKALRLLAMEAGMEWSLDEQGIYDFLSLSVVPQPYTIFQDVFALPAASYMIFDGTDLDIQRYWQLKYVPKTTLHYPEVLDRTRHLVAEAVTMRLRSDVSMGLFLSGGIDSAVVAYEASRVKPDLQTYTIAVDDSKYDESALASRTAAALGVQNTVLPLEPSPLEDLLRLIRHYDQPYADSSAIPSVKISDLARQHVTVVLNGDGGDELFAGYRRYLAAASAATFDWMPTLVPKTVRKMLNRVSYERQSATGLLARFFRGLPARPGERYLIWLTDMLLESDKRKNWKGLPQRPTENWIESILLNNLTGLDMQMAGDVQVNLLSDLLVKMDMATMASSLEARSPFLDHVLAEFAATLSDRQRLKGWQTKAVLRDAYRGLLPDTIISSRKRGFEVPLVSWLRKDLHELLMDTVGSDSARVRYYLDSSFVDELLDGRTMGDRNWGYIVYALLVLELWLRDFRSGMV